MGRSLRFVATAILLVHLLWIAAVIFGTPFTRGRPVWTGLHLGSLIWGIIVEVAPVPCPLTLLEQHVEAMAGMATYQGSFLMHYLDRIIYPDLPWWLVATVGASICALNLGIYGWRFRRWRKMRAAHSLQ